jgi:hypothetical protein
LPHHLTSLHLTESIFHHLLEFILDHFPSLHPNISLSLWAAALFGRVLTPSRRTWDRVSWIVGSSVSWLLIKRFGHRFTSKRNSFWDGLIGRGTPCSSSWLESQGDQKFNFCSWYSEPRGM